MSVGTFFKNVGIGIAAGAAMGATFGLMSKMAPFGGFWCGFPSIWGFGGFWGGSCFPPPPHHHHHCHSWWC